MGAVLFLLIVWPSCGPAGDSAPDSAGSRLDPGSPEGPPGGAQAAEREWPDVARLILAWLECDECTAGELDSVVALRDEAVPTLARALAEGPSGARVAELRGTLAAGAVRRRELMSGTRLTFQGQRYIDAETGTLRSIYRIRAARALAAIGGDAALEALRAVSDSTGFPEDVRTAIRTAEVSIVR